MVNLGTGINVPHYSADKGSPSNGDIWYNDTTNTLRARINGVTVDLGGGGGGGASVKAAILADVKAYNADGGDITSSAMRTRDLNTIISDPDSIISSLSGNDFTIGAGTYKILWSAPGYQCGKFISELYDVTSSTSLQKMGSAKASSGDYSMTRSEGSFIVVPASSNAYRIRMESSDTTSGVGMGVSHGISGHSNYYTIVNVLKLA